MNHKIADRIQGIKAFYVMELLQRAKQLEQQGRHIIHLEIGEPDFPTPAAIITAGIENIKTGQIKYTPAAGLMALRIAIADFYRHRYNVAINPERILITPGASGAFLLAMGVSLNPGEEVLLADPSYPCNSNFIRLFGGVPRALAVNAETAYQLNAEMVKNNWNKQMRGVLVASPSNPTGTIISAQSLQQIIATTETGGGCFYSDEIYHGLVYNAHAVTSLQFSDDVFVINSFSKYFGMTGWRVGWLIVPEGYIAAAGKLAQNIFISTATHSQYAALAAFNPQNLALLETRRQAFAERRDFLFQGLQELGFDIAMKPEGAFYIYANCSRFTDDSFDFARQLLETEGVAITPGKDFGVNAAQQHLRFAYTSDIDSMAEGLKRIANFIT